MSTAPISATSASQQLQAYFQQRKTDLQQLRGALESGDLAGAQKAFKSIQQLASVGPSPTGNAFAISQRQQDYSAVGQALTSGNLAGAQQAFAHLVGDFHHTDAPSSVGPAVVVNITAGAAGGASGSGAQATGSAGAGGSTDLTINLGNSSTPETVTIGINNTSAGEQLSISVAGQQGSNPENLTLNLGQNSNEQIVINLLTAQQSSSQNTAQGSGVNLTA